MDFDINDQDLNQPEHEYFPEDNQPFLVAAQPLPNQLAGIAEDNALVRYKNGTIQLFFTTIYTLIQLLPIANPKMTAFSDRMENFNKRNEKRKTEAEKDQRMIEEENDIDMREIQQRIDRRKAEEKDDMRKLGREIIEKEFYHALKAALKKELVLKVVHSLLKKPFASLAEFYCRVLSVFMLNTSLPQRLNGLLKGGVCNQADDLLPFLLVMCQAFFCQTLTLNQVNGVKDVPPFNFYQEVEADEEGYFPQKRVQLKEFWVMKTKMPSFLHPLRRDKIRDGGFLYETMERVRVGEFSDRTRYIRTCLHIEVPEEITRDRNYSVYLRLVQDKILFVKEANQVILAPGCDFIVEELFEIPLKKISASQEKNDDLDNKKIRVIRLKMVAKVGERIHLEEQQEPRRSVEEDQESREPVEEPDTISSEESEETEPEPEFYQPNFRFYLG